MLWFDIFGLDDVPAEVLSYYEWYMQEPMTTLGEYFRSIFNWALYGSLAAAVGMFFYVPFSRPVFVVCTVGAIVSVYFTLMDAPVLLPAGAQIVDLIDNILTGVVIALSFSSAVTARYAARAT